jgi:hypothetical protein
MALKFGRTAGITSRIDPITGTTMYTEDEYDAYNTAVEDEKSRKSAYDESVKKYDTQYASYYGKNTVDTKAASGMAGQLNKSGAKGTKGENISWSGSGGMTQAEQDKQFDEKVKRGEIVSFNDPSISAKTRELITGASRGTDLSKSYVQKGLDLKSYKDMYGDNYDPVQFRKDALAGKLDKYEVGTIHSPKEGTGAYTRGVTPVKPGPYVPGPKVQKIDPKNVDWKERKLDPLKPTKIDEKPLGKLRPAKEDITWDAPKFVKAKGIGVPQTRIKSSGKSGIEGGGKKKIVGGTAGSKIKYNTEQRRSAAYYGDNTSTGEKITGKTESELRQLKKETRGEGGIMLKEGRLGDALTIGKDLSQIRKATRYAKDADLSVGSKTGLTLEGQGSNLRYFTPERTKTVIEDGKQVRGEGAMSGYKDYQTQEKGKVFRSQADNPANRNRTWDRIQGPSEGASNSPATQSIRDQQKTKFKTDNPTASPRQIRQGARAQQKADEELMRKVDKKIIK